MTLAAGCPAEPLAMAAPVPTPAAAIADSPDEGDARLAEVTATIRQVIRL